MSHDTTSKPERSFLSAAVESISPWTSRSSTPKPGPPNKIGNGPKTQPAADHSVSFRQGLSLRRYPKDCPPLETRWFYAVDTPKRKPRLLKETPMESKPLPPAKKFAPFSLHDSCSIEAAYQRLVEEDEDAQDARSGDENPQTGPDTADIRENTSIYEAGNLEQGGRIKVPVNEDFLFDVDVEKRELAPVYWLGPIYEVRRGTWFYQESSGLRPCEENLATQLEDGYLKVKPFRHPKLPDKANGPVKPENDLKLQPTGDATGVDSSDLTPKPSINNLKDVNKCMNEYPGGNLKDPAGLTAAESQDYRLFGSYMNSIVTYQDDTIAWLSSDGIFSRVSSTVYQHFAGGGYLGGVKLVRGYTVLSKPPKPSETSSERPHTPVAGTTTKSDNTGLQLGEEQQRILKRRSAPARTTFVAENTRNDTTGNFGLPESHKAALEQNITSMFVDSLDSENDEEVARRREEREIQTDYVEHEGEDQSREIEHLILVTHGIGQRLGMRTESVNFVHDVNVLRQTLKSVYLNSADLQALNGEIDKLPKNCRIQVLPVFWRHELEFPKRSTKQTNCETDIGETPDDDELYPTLDDITINGAHFVRSLITDLALDILLYQSAYREHICRIVLRECNRIYKLFLDRNPYFEGKVSLIGHSLGSAVLFDILCRQKERDIKIHGSSQHSKYYHARSNRTNAKQDAKDLSLDFAVEDFYCLGSPIGLFQMLKGRTIAARHHPGAIPAESPMDPESMDDPFLAAANPASRYSTSERISATTLLPFTISSPKCAQIYNIFYPSDPISYRLEPLIAPAMSSLRPQALPYTKKGLFSTSAAQGLTGIGARVGQSVSGFWSSLSSGIASSLLNRSLGLTGEEIANMTGPQAQLSPGAGTNITEGGVISEVPSLMRSDTNEKQRQLAEDTAAADRKGGGTHIPALIDDEIETLYSGFQNTRKSQQSDGKSHREWVQSEEKGKRLRREELKVRGLNDNGRVDYSIQESVLDFNPINTIASHLNYWADEDVSHFMMSQLLSRHRNYKKTRT